MRRFHFVSVLLLIVASSVNAQQVIYGTILNSDSIPLFGVNIYQEAFYNSTRSNPEGKFRFVVDTTLKQQLIFEKEGYRIYSLDLSDSLQVPILISMEAEGIKYRPHWSPRGWGMKFNIDVLTEDFSAFTSDLGVENVETLNRVAGIFNGELTIKGRHIRTGFLWGYIQTSNSDPDSINIELRNTVVGISFAHLLIDKNRFYLYPKFTFKNYRYRLLNGIAADEIPLTNFMKNKDFDLRINQNIGSVGFEFGFKFRTKRMVAHAYNVVGLYGGYAFKMSRKPFVRSVLSTIETTNTLTVRPLNLGVFFSSNIEAKY